MSLITKCYSCTNEIVFPAGQSIVECVCCGRKNSRPRSQSGDELTLMKYANERRNMGEFAAAEQAYSKILQNNLAEHEARWGLLLCKYGVQYVEDAGGRERVITCRRTCTKPFRQETDFRLACEQAPGEIREAYEKDGQRIEAIQREIDHLDKTAAPYQIFICYKETSPEDGSRTPDSVLAQNIHQVLTRRGYHVFYAPVSLQGRLGANYEASIFHAVKTAKVMLVLGTKPEYMESTWVRSEWKRYLDRIDAGEKQLLIPMYKDFSPYQLPKEFTSRFLQGLDMNDVGFMYDLEDAVMKVVRPEPKAPPKPPVSEEETLLHRGLMDLSDGDFSAAQRRLNEYLNKYPEDARANLAMAMAELRAKDEDGLVEICAANSAWKNIKYMGRAEKFGDEKIKDLFARILEAEKKAREEREAAEKAEKERQEREAAEKAEKERQEREAAEKARRQKNAEFTPAEATNLLAKCYRKGNGVAQNEEEAQRMERAAFGFWMKAAQAGDAEAMEMVGRRYEEGEGVEKDADEAQSWYRNAVEQYQKDADAGSAKACMECAGMYYFGNGVKKDWKTAEKYYRRAISLYARQAEKGDREAMFGIGEIYNIWLKKDNMWDHYYEEAVPWYRKAAELGHAGAYYSLGLLYRYGNGVPKDEEQEQACFAASVKCHLEEIGRGSVKSMSGLAYMYSEGLGVEKDPKEAERWRRAYAEELKRLVEDAGVEIHGELNPESIDAVPPVNEEKKPEAEPLDNGGMPVIDGFDDCLRLAQRGDANAMYQLGQKFYAGDGVAANKEEAFKWFERSAVLDDMRAQCRLGFMYEQGDGVGKNESQAYLWFQKSADQGYAVAQYKTGLYYMKKADPADPKLAHYWLTLAVEQGHAGAKQALVELNYQPPKEKKPEQKPKESGSRQENAAAPEDEFTFVSDGDGYQITKYIGRRTTVIVPEEIRGRKVLSIGVKAFNSSILGNKTLESVVIPESVTTICDYAFWKCYALRQVKLHKGVKRIGAYAFNACKSIENIDFGMGDCPPKVVKLPQELVLLGGYAFVGTGLKEITLSRKTKLSLAGKPTKLPNCAIFYYEQNK